ncbi:RagB/SusD family nutrient uptake outer membrane protein [Niabella insulamsoli]|uniref:RagB/SusD family nutrient uptake outer membrane protein n=1 Tax=Niabella insulamsoli TaxID=3144874 RepID=UPI0031FE0310
MKKILYLLLTGNLLLLIPSCKPSLDIPPTNIINDADIFSNAAGITAFMARVYSQMPIEDFKWNPSTGFKSFFNGSTATFTGEAISRDQAGGTEGFNYWADAYILIRDCNYFLETLASYASNFSEAQMNNWRGEVRFIRAFTYFALVKRYGGVPIIDKLLTAPGQSIEEVAANIESFKIPRAAEADVYDFIASDLDFAYNNLPESNQKGRASKYAAAAFKSRVMLFAGCVAKYNVNNLTNGSVQVCGIPAAKATGYFKASYDAANLLDNKFSLYKAGWSATDPEAQANNFAQLFLDPASAENIFIRMYKYPDAVHWWDYNNVPRQLWNNGGAAQTNPTLNFVEMFEGLPKNLDGSFKTTDDNGKYLLYDDLNAPFLNAEPRLKGTILFPGDIFKGVTIEMRRGIYTGPVAGGIDRLLPLGSTAAYPTTNFISQAGPEVTTAFVTLPDGSRMNAAGASGFYTNINGVASGISGFSVKKYIVPTKPASELANNRSDQSWIEIRYAEVLLNRAEAAYELFSAGQGAAYQTQALADVNEIRERAGATLATTADLATIDLVRKERRKELAFENKTWWDLKRWRIIDKEQNGTQWRILNPIFALNALQYFFDDRPDERNSRFTFDPRWYYQRIPDAVIAKSPNIVQNPGY